ncbi:MAG: monovalent cation/H(+) antiporter subunit G [Myxococcota bacterium]|jgi:multicomponent Na+:H+ antiporter subunit G|nr:monovalent cation/H(+) antiporter subunit G [Myxococcota bacterium]
MSIWVLILCLLGSALLLISSLGLFRLPDSLSRQHAATKSTTLALWLVLLGAAFSAGDFGWWLRVLLLIGLLLVTLPVASHMLARAAARESFHDEVVREGRCTRESSER